MKISIIHLLAILLLLASCADKSNPPLEGKRINVLHYDLLKGEEASKFKIHASSQEVNNSWPISDIGQFTDIPTNITLQDNIKLSQKVNPRYFYPSYMDSAALVVSDIFYSYTGTTLAAYNLLTEKNLWSVSAVKTSDEKQDIIGGSIAYYKDVLYLSSGGRDFIAFEASSGKELWRARLPNVVRNIALVRNNQIYVSSTDNTVSCFNLSGKLIWRYDAPIYSLISSRLYIPSVSYGNKVITITTAGDLVVLNRHDGEELTQVNLAASSIIGDGSLAKGPIASPVLNKHNLYILTGESNLLKIDLENPAVVWQKSFAGAKSFWVTPEVVYILTEDNQLLAVEGGQGKIVWMIDLPKEPNNKDLDSFYGPVFAGNQLIVTNANGKFFTFSPYDGKLTSSNKTSLSFNRAPIVVNEKAYFIGTNGHVEIWK